MRNNRMEEKQIKDMTMAEFYFGWNKEQLEQDLKKMERELEHDLKEINLFEIFLKIYDSCSFFWTDSIKSTDSTVINKQFKDLLKEFYNYSGDDSFPLKYAIRKGKLYTVAKGEGRRIIYFALRHTSLSNLDKLKLSKHVLSEKLTIQDLYKIWKK